MDYATYQHFVIAPADKYHKTILLVGFESVLEQLYASHLARHYTVLAFVNYPTAGDSVPPDRVGVVIVSVDSGVPVNGVLGNIFSQFPGTPIITVGNELSESFLDVIMKLGVRHHVNQKFSRPQDIITIVQETLLEHC